MLIVTVLCAGCAKGPGDAESAGGVPVLRLATTTSTRDSGLLDALVPRFEAIQGCRVDVVAVGTGAALKLGESGDADVLITHARTAEEQFLAAGFGVRHEGFMFNFFVIIGPADDPAMIRDLPAAAALRRLAAGRFRFVSRGDNSGTHQREQALWEAAGGRPNWPNYLETGQGMGPSLIIADEKRAYVLADQGTFLRFRPKLNLIALVKSGQELRNPYAAIVVQANPRRAASMQLANAFVDFLISPETQRKIDGFRAGGERLFHPTRLETKTE